MVRNNSLRLNTNMGLENPIVFMDVKIGEEKVGRMIIELYANVVPKTAENFLALCVGNHTSQTTNKKLHYKGTIFHKAIPGVFIQGGDVTNFDGTGGESIFGFPFEDENYELKHDRPGILSAVNSGKNCNNSQFIITACECPHLDGSSVVFGQVIKGLACAIELSEVKTEDDYPAVVCMIEDCGQLLLGDPWDIIDQDGTDDVYPFDPRDLEMDCFKINDLRNILLAIRESGNNFFAKGNYIEADRKYKKAIRYLNYWTTHPTCNLIEDNGRNAATEELEKEKLCCLLNSAAVALKKGLFRRSLHFCDEVLKKEKLSAKAYYRRGLALKYLNDYEGALECQRKALSLAPNDKSITYEIQDVTGLIKKYLVHEKEVFSRMFYALK